MVSSINPLSNTIARRHDKPVGEDGSQTEHVVVHVVHDP
jgi:hypothetical protein